MMTNPLLTTLIALGPSGLSSLPVQSLASTLKAFNLLDDKTLSVMEEFPADHLIKDVPVQVLLTLGISGLQRYASNLQDQSASLPSPQSTGLPEGMEFGHQQRCRNCNKVSWYQPAERFVANDGSVTVTCHYCNGSTTAS